VPVTPAPVEPPFVVVVVPEPAVVLVLPAVVVVLSDGKVRGAGAGPSMKWM
jgi:hypothetical protein